MDSSFRDFVESKPLFLKKKRANSTESNTRENNLNNSNKNQQQNTNNLLNINKITLENYYKNFLNLNWEENNQALGQKICEQIKPCSLVFLYNSLYFNTNFLSIYNKFSSKVPKLIREFFAKKAEEKTIKKSSETEEKQRLMNQIKSLTKDFPVLSNLTSRTENKNIIRTRSMNKKVVEKVGAEPNENLGELLKLIHFTHDKIQKHNSKKLEILSKKTSLFLQETEEKKPSKRSQNFIGNNTTNSSIINSLKNLEFIEANINSNEIFEYFEHLIQVKSEENLRKKSMPKVFDIDEEINKANEQDDWVCFICNNGDLCVDDVIIQCQMCNISVHQSCYGINNEDTKMWVCDLCKHYKNKEDVIKTECLLCPIKGGAMKESELPKDCEFVKTINRIKNGEKINAYNSSIIIPIRSRDNKKKATLKCSRKNSVNSLVNESECDCLNHGEKDNKINDDFCCKNDFFLTENKVKVDVGVFEDNNKITFDKVEKSWVHLSCALWHEQVYFGNFKEKREIKYIDTISFKRFYDRCDICGYNNKGPCVKCNFQNCSFKCHPECGRMNGIKLVIEHKEKLEFNLYCYEHAYVTLIKVYESLDSYKKKINVDFGCLLKKLSKNSEKEHLNDVNLYSYLMNYFNNNTKLSSEESNQDTKDSTSKETNDIRINIRLNKDPKLIQEEYMSKKGRLIKIKKGIYNENV